MTDIKTWDLSVRLCKDHKKLPQIDPDIQTETNMRIMDVKSIQIVAYAGGNLRIFTLGANVFNYRQDFFIVFILMKTNL